MCRPAPTLGTERLVHRVPHPCWTPARPQWPRMLAAEETGGLKGHASGAGSPLRHLTPVCGLRRRRKRAFALL